LLVNNTHSLHACSSTGAQEVRPRTKLSFIIASQRTQETKMHLLDYVHNVRINCKYEYSKSKNIIMLLVLVTGTFNLIAGCNVWEFVTRSKNLLCILRFWPGHITRVTYSSCKVNCCRRRLSKKVHFKRFQSLHFLVFV
jgi:hypothetical protein